MQLVLSGSCGTRGNAPGFAKHYAFNGLGRASVLSGTSLLPKCLPGFGHGAHGIRAAKVALRVQATVADPPKKDQASVMPRGTHWQVC